MHTYTKQHFALSLQTTVMLMCADEWHHSLILAKGTFLPCCLITAPMIVRLPNANANLGFHLAEQLRGLPFVVITSVVRPTHTHTTAIIISPPGANLLSAWLLLLPLLPGKNVTWRKRERESHLTQWHCTHWQPYRCTEECLWRLPLLLILLLLCVLAV